MALMIAIGIATGCVYGIVAVGYSLIYRMSGVVNFATGSYVMVGGLLADYFVRQVRLPYASAIVLAVIASSAVGMLLWSLLVLPLWRRRTAAYAVLVGTIVFGAAVGNVMLLIAGPVPRTPPAWIPGFRVQLADATVDGQYVLVVVGTLLLLIAFGLMLRYTTIGRSMRAIAASRDTSELLGISPERMGALAMTMTAGLGGLGGVLIAPAQFTSADAGLTYGVLGFVAAVIGGFGSLPGALAGGVLLGVLETLIGRYISTDFVTVIAFAVLLLLLAVRPQGLVGQRWTQEE